MVINNLQQQAYESIRKQIIYSELAPGSKISDKVLEEQLAIGRTPIREALIQLRQSRACKNHSTVRHLCFKNRYPICFISPLYAGKVGKTDPARMQCENDQARSS